MLQTVNIAADQYAGGHQGVSRCTNPEDGVLAIDPAGALVDATLQVGGAPIALAGGNGTCG